MSDGKVETYTRCVEHLCGSADTFFTSVFGAQARQLSDYRNAEIKTLLADLLGQEQTRELGRKAGETAKLLKAGLVALRQEAAAMDSETGRLARAQSDAADAPATCRSGPGSRDSGSVDAGEARQVYAQVTVQREQAREADARRAQLLQEREAVQAAGRTGMQELEDREKDELQRLDRLTRRAAQRQAQVGQRRERLEDAQARCRALLAWSTGATPGACRRPSGCWRCALSVHARVETRWPSGSRPRVSCALWCNGFRASSAGGAGCLAGAVAPAPFGPGR